MKTESLTLPETNPVKAKKMTLEQALEAFKAEFPGWWWKV
jgi:hypothetical protein